MTETTTPNKTEFSLLGENQVKIARLINAPIERVFDAYTDPEKVKQWWGPREYECEIDIFEAKRGGRWRFLNKTSEGNEYGFLGVFHEVTAPSRIVQTFEFEGAPGYVSLEQIALEEVDGKTQVTAVASYNCPEDRDAMINAGMESGATVSYDRLAELTESSG